ncbi:MAG TPA: O-antigen ligase family protein [Chroococcales cyanobacterium]
MESVGRQKIEPEAGTKSSLLDLIDGLKLFQGLVVIFYSIVLSHPITYPWIGLIAGLVVWSAIALLSLSAGEGIRFEKPPLTLPIALFALACTVSGAVNGGVKEGVGALLTLRTFLVYFWAYQVFSSAPKLKSYSLQAMLLVGALGGIWGTIQQVCHYHPVGYQYLQGTGFLATPMQFAGIMQIFALISAAIFLKGAYIDFLPGLNRRTGFGFITLANCLGLIFAGERSAWLGFIVAALVVGSLVSFRLVLIGIVSALILGVVAWNTIPVFKQRLEPLAHPQQDVSTTARWHIWQESWKQFERKPVLGVGPRGFQPLKIPEAQVPGYSNQLDHAHSNYLHILTTTGVVGFLAYLYLCLATLRLTFTGSRRGTPSGGKDEPLPGYEISNRSVLNRAIALGLFGATISLMVAGLFEYNFGTGQVRLAYWFVLGLLTTARRRS